MLLPVLIAAGVIPLSLEAPVGNIVAVDECTVVAVRQQADTPTATSLPNGAPVWRQAFDPGDHVPYAYDFGPLLSEGEKIATIVALRLSAAAAALGIAIDQASGFGPIVDDEGGAKVQLWFLVDNGSQDAPQFDASGTRIAVTFRVRTDAQRSFERSAILIVRQQ